MTSSATNSAKVTELPETAVAIPLRLRVPAPSTVNYPVTFGVPLPRGRVRDVPQLALSVGEQLASASGRATAHWPDGSIRWLLVDAILPRLHEGCCDGTLLLDAARAQESGAHVSARQTHDQVVIELSDIPLVVKTDTSGLAVEVPGAASAIPIDVQLTLSQVEQDTPKIQEVQLEQSGPVRATVVTRGEYELSRLRFTTRLSVFSCGVLKCDFTLHNPRRAQHTDGLWDLGDSGSCFFRDLSWHLPFGESFKPSVHWKPEPEAELKLWDGSPLKIVQRSSGGDSWNSRIHVNYKGEIPCRGPNYEIKGAATNREGRRADPLVVADLNGSQISVAVPEFWQQFPSALEVSSKGVRVGLFPSEWEDLFELQGGESKTLTVMWQINTDCQGNDLPPRFSSQSAVVVASPDWNRACGAAPFLPGCADQKLDDLLDRAIHGNQSFFEKREVVDEYGWRNYGDVWADHEETYYDGPRPIISHYNNQFDIVYGAVLQLMRTSDFAWYDILDPLARHVVDIDIYHTIEDKPAYNNGMFWFTDHYRDAVTSTHRTYSRANRPGDGRPYGGGPGSEHNFSTGLLYYYYLTGSQQAADDVVGLAEWVINMDDGAQDVLGVVDDGATGRASMCGSLDYHGPGRGAANSINVLLDAWMLTHDDRYLDMTDRLIRRCIHPEDEISDHDLLNAEKRWSYTMFLTSLVKYLQIKLDWQMTDEMFDYARQSILHYAEWMSANERPYLDHPESLEYPTEAWAAQEFRKANALRMAALFTNDEAADRWFDKGNEFSDRAWQDLHSFDTCHFTRAIAVMMIEGTSDAYFRSTPRAVWHDKTVQRTFSPATPFEPQRTRVTRRMKTLSGMAGYSIRLLNPFRWNGWSRSRKQANLLSHRRNAP